MNNLEESEQFYKNMDLFVNRRIYQLKNWDEVYKTYAINRDLEWDIATTEVDLIRLCNTILEADTEQLQVLKDMATDVLFGRMDDKALELMARCDTTKELPYVHI